MQNRILMFFGLHIIFIDFYKIKYMKGGPLKKQTMQNQKKNL